MFLFLFFHPRIELASVVGLKGCVKGFQFQKKDFNLLEEPGTIGISSGCPEESFVGVPSTSSHSVNDNALCVCVSEISNMGKEWMAHVISQLIFVSLTLTLTLG